MWSATMAHLTKRSLAGPSLPSVKLGSNFRGGSLFIQDGDDLWELFKVEFNSDCSSAIIAVGDHLERWRIDVATVEAVMLAGRRAPTRAARG